MLNYEKAIKNKSKSTQTVLMFILMQRKQNENSSSNNNRNSYTVLFSVHIFFTASFGWVNYRQAKYCFGGSRGVGEHDFTTKAKPADNAHNACAAPYSFRSG